MNAVILSCTTLMEYVRQAQNVCHTDYPVIELDRQYHVEPEKMREHIEVINGIEFIQVHPTFLYESVWNIGVLIILLLWRKHKKFNGEIF